MFTAVALSKIAVSTMNKICMLSPFDAKELRERNTRPDCRDHGHCNEKKAAELVASGRARAVGSSITSGRIGNPNAPLGKKLEQSAKYAFPTPFAISSTSVACKWVSPRRRG